MSMPITVKPVPSIITLPSSIWDYWQMLTQWRWDFVVSALVLSLLMFLSQEDN